MLNPTVIKLYNICNYFRLNKLNRDNRRGGRDNRTIEVYNTVSKEFTKVSALEKSVFSSQKSRKEFGISVYRRNSLLIAGGEDGKSILRKNSTDNCFVFNTKTQAIRYVGSLKSKRYRNVLVNFKGEIFCIGGWNQTHRSLNSIEVFDANTEEWKTSDLKLGIGRIHHKAVAHKQFIYVLGGISESGRTDSTERIDA